MTQYRAPHNLPLTRLRLLAAAILAILPWVWLGIVVGISVLETPLRFRTPPITHAGAAMLGVAVFHALAYVELAFLVLLMGAVLIIADRRRLLAIAGLGLVIAIEHSILVPLLAARAILLVQGTTPEPSAVHSWAVFAEAGKMLLLAIVGIFSYRHAK